MIKIIAEVAQGYEGNYYKANKLLKGSIKSNADAIKYQLIYADEICTTRYPYFNFFKSLELDFIKWKKITKNSKNKIEIFFDIYGKKSFRVAKKLKADGVKISSADSFNFELINDSLKSFKKVFISISGLDVRDIKRIYNKIKKFKKKVIFMFGIQSEPTLIKDNNFLKLKKLMKIFPSIEFGLMEHTDGSDKLSKYLPLVVLGYGITYIEKHITIDRKLKLEDYISALSFKDFRNFSEIIKKSYKSLGSENLKITKKEKRYKRLTSKVLVAAKNLKKGTLLNKQNTVLKRDTLKVNFKNLINFSQIKNKKIQKNKNYNEPIYITDI